MREFLDKIPDYQNIIDTTRGVPLDVSQQTKEERKDIHTCPILYTPNDINPPQYSTIKRESTSKHKCNMTKTTITRNKFRVFEHSTK
jgi:hypothetical protein